MSDIMCCLLPAKMKYTFGTNWMNCSSIFVANSANCTHLPVPPTRNKTPSVTLVPRGFDYKLEKVTEDYAEFWQCP